VANFSKKNIFSKKKTNICRNLEDRGNDLNYFTCYFPYIKLIIHFKDV